MTDGTSGWTEPEPSKSDVEAVDWLIRLTEMISDPAVTPVVRQQTQDEFNAWATLSEANLRSFLETMAVYEALEGCEAEMAREFAAHVEASEKLLPPLIPAKNGLAVVDTSGCAIPTQKRTRAPRPKSARITAAAAAIGALALGIAWWRWTDGITYRTLAGQQQRVALEDGSVVFLNEQSEIRVSFSSATRRIRLLHGEALFDVKHDPTRPFVVLSRTALIQAVGTSFDVSQNSGATRVAVLEGSVSVTRASDALLPLPTTRRDTQDLPMKLMPREVAEINSREVAKQEQVDVEKMVAWQTAELVVDHEPLSQIAREFNQHNRRQLTIADPDAGEKRITGTYRTDDPEGLVGAVQQIYQDDLAVQETDDGWVVTTKQGSGRN
jgi:transmembrane sensor